MFSRYRISDFDFKLIVYVIMLALVGIFAVGSAKESLMNRQIMGVVVGVFLMVVITLMDYSVLLRAYWIIYAVNLVLLVLVNVMGHTSGGAQRWINIAGIQFQPSEIAKLSLILFYAAFIKVHMEQLNTILYILLCIVLFLPVIFLIYNQPDMSTSLMTSVLFLVIMFVGGVSWKVVIGFFAIVIPGIMIFFSLIMQPDQTIIKDYQRNRILGWIYPEEYEDTVAYQQTNSVTAIGSGQLMGKGYRNNEISSVKNGNFISQPQTDFIFAVIGEEFGFMGTCTVIVLLILISFECIIIGMKSPDVAGRIIGAGMGALIAFQGFMNIGVATGVLPNTGIPLPFVSYGLTSLDSLFIGIGFVLSVGKEESANRMYREGSDEYSIDRK
ncbi:MAG: FtsW/RodA/SpoVE family cell cycle protein [Lachnospiraceae bacterium]|nr:FtsW/RodA/SpoVE family cell cycle protein [Lachnospiraceae bacterium]